MIIKEKRKTKKRKEKGFFSIRLARRQGFSGKYRKDMCQAYFPENLSLALLPQHTGVINFTFSFFFDMYTIHNKNDKLS